MKHLLPTWLLFSLAAFVHLPARAQTSEAPPLRLQVSPNSPLAAGQSTHLEATATQAPSALLFDGIDDVVNLPGSTDAAGNYSPALSSVTNTFTVEAWVKPTATHEIDQQYPEGAAGTSGQRYLIFPTGGWNWGSTDASMGISVGTNGVSVYEHADNYMPPLLVRQGTLSGWTHLAVVYENRVPRLYINGRLVARGIFTHGSFAYVHPSLGFGGGYYGYYQGGVGGIRIWRTARTDAQIQQSQLDEALGNNADLVGDWRLTEGQGATVADQGPQALTGQLSTPNGPSWLLAPTTSPALSWQWEPAEASQNNWFSPVASNNLSYAAPLPFNSHLGMAYKPAKLDYVGAGAVSGWRVFRCVRITIAIGES